MRLSVFECVADGTTRGHRRKQIERCRQLTDECCAAHERACGKDLLLHGDGRCHQRHRPQAERDSEPAGPIAGATPRTIEHADEHARRDRRRHWMTRRIAGKADRQHERELDPRQRVSGAQASERGRGPCRGDLSFSSSSNARIVDIWTYPFCRSGRCTTGFMRLRESMLHCGDASRYRRACFVPNTQRLALHGWNGSCSIPPMSDDQRSLE